MRQIRDLLTPQSDNKGLDVRLAIGPTGVKSWHVPDAAMRTVGSSAEVAATMLEGERNRAVGQTNMNERSSRSHSVVSIQVAGRDVRSGTKLSGFLNLVDLAGSERVGRSEATGARLKEAQHINKSLSALGDVINAHANKSSHIPFRNSKLTTLLQDSLGGRAKVCMFVHINPETASSGESLSTLYFAQRAATVTLGGARVNMESGEVETLTKNLKKAQEDLEQREAEVLKLRQAARSGGGGAHGGAIDSLQQRRHDGGGVEPCSSSSGARLGGAHGGARLGRSTRPGGGGSGAVGCSGRQHSGAGVVPCSGTGARLSCSARHLAGSSGSGNAGSNGARLGGTRRSLCGASGALHRARRRIAAPLIRGGLAGLAQRWRGLTHWVLPARGPEDLLSYVQACTVSKRREPR